MLSEVGENFDRDEGRSGGGGGKRKREGEEEEEEGGVSSLRGMRKFVWRAQMNETNSAGNVKI